MLGESGGVGDSSIERRYQRGEKTVDRAMRSVENA